MASVLTLLTTAAKLGPQVVDLVRWAWPRIRDNEAAQQQLQRLLDRLVEARRAATRRDRLGREIDVLRQEATTAAAWSDSEADRQRRAQWLAHLDRLASGVRMLETTTGRARLQYARRLRRELTRLREEMFAATVGATRADLPSPASTGPDDADERESTDGGAGGA